MFISMNWISDFVDLSGLDKLDLISKFSLSTAEVENEIFFKGQDLEGVVVAEILSVEEHPDSKKLHILKVDIGEATPTQVVCGAPNVRVGMKTAFAKVGARLGEITIAPRPLAGVDSFGMCCSEKEIGISDNHDGIMEITDDVKNGTDIKEIYAIDDIVFEVDNKSLTNRPDLWGHYGIAREFATIAHRPLKPIEQIDLSKYDNLDKIDLKFSDNAAVCVILASDGYPEHYEKGFEITGLEKFKDKNDFYCFHAGTKFDKDGKIVTNGGRVLGVTAVGTDLPEARKKAYEATGWVSFANKYMRTDIGKAIDEVKFSGENECS